MAEIYHGYAQRIQRWVACAYKKKIKDVLFQPLIVFGKIHTM